MTRVDEADKLTLFGEIGWFCSARDLRHFLNIDETRIVMFTLDHSLSCTNFRPHSTAIIFIPRIQVVGLKKNLLLYITAILNFSSSSESTILA